MKNTRRGQKLYSVTAAIFAILALNACGNKNEPTPGPPSFSNGDGSGDSYIVVLKKSSKDFSTENLSQNESLLIQKAVSKFTSQYKLPQARQVFSSINGGVYQINEIQALALSHDTQVAYVEKNNILHINTDAIEFNATWGIDRIDQSNLPLDNKYSFELSGASVHAYVIDTGILTSHLEFQGRASAAIDIVDSQNNAVDCNGHGTHVAGTIGSLTYGVAKNVLLHAVRVLDCQGSGTIANVIAGIEWVTTHHLNPAVANMSLGGGASQALDDAVSASIQSGVTYTIAAGNDNSVACNSSPANVAAAIVVGATDITDRRSSFSNVGLCVSLFAPGTDIKSTWIGSNFATNTISGTSMATPHVAGVAALYLAKNPSATPAQVKTALVTAGIQGKITDVGLGSPNILLNVHFASSVAPVPTPTPTPASPVGGNLINNEPVGNLADTAGGEKRFTLIVPANSASLTISLSGGGGDADLYVKNGAQPTLTVYKCRPYLIGNNETCNFTNPVAGSWFILLKSYSSYFGATLKAVINSK